MFKVDFIVEDKYLAGVLHALAEFRVLNLTNVPVVNAVVKAGKVQQAEPGTSMIAQLTSKIAKFAEGTVLTTAQIMAMVIEVGGNKSSSSYFIGQLRESGSIKPVKNRRGHYQTSHN